jgi:5-methylcytosine-specific restriction endonuclease McrA
VGAARAQHLSDVEVEVDAEWLNTYKKRNRKIEKLKLADTTSDNEVKREPISDEVKMHVWKRDGGRCVNCGSKINLEFDHIIPVSMGGSNTARNIQLLCEECNRRKGGNLV